MSDRDTLVQARGQISAVLKNSPEWRYRIMEPVALLVKKKMILAVQLGIATDSQFLEIADEIIRLNFESEI